MKLMLACLGLLMSIPLKLAAQEVATDHSSTFDFSRLQAFAVKVGTPWGEPSSEAAAKQAIAKRLVKRGWKETDESSCDALVVLHGHVQESKPFAHFIAIGLAMAGTM